MDKALISDLTWRSLEMQKKTFPDMPHFIAPDEIPSLLRMTTRSATLHIWVVSLAVVAKTEKDFTEFLLLLKSRKACLHSTEECVAVLSPTMSFSRIVKIWKAARRAGAAKAGGKISAANREADSRSKCAKIKDRWPLSNKQWRTPELLAEADLSYNTAIKFLGKRPIAQYNYQAKMKRAANKVRK